MSDNIEILVSKNGQYEQPIKTSGFLLIYMSGETFKFTGTLELKAITPLLLKFAMEKMTK